MQRYSIELDMVLGSAVSASGERLAILSKDEIVIYSMTARAFLKAIPIHPAEHTATIDFIDEATVIAGSREGYITIASTAGLRQPEFVDFPGTGSRKPFHLLINRLLTGCHMRGSRITVFREC